MDEQVYDLVEDEVASVEEDQVLVDSEEEVLVEEDLPVVDKMIKASRWNDKCPTNDW